MTGKRYETALYDDKAIAGYCVLDKLNPSVTARLHYKNVFISTKEGCDIVTGLLNGKEWIINEMGKTLRVYDDAYIDLNKKYKEVVEENEELKQRVKGLTVEHALSDEGHTYKNNQLSKENKQLKERLDYIQSSITEAINHSKTGLEQKALKKVIEDYNEYMLGHLND